MFALATRPKTIIGPLFSRYRPGHAYGTHVDDALIGGARTDVSFTLFLADPETYDGGELIIDTASGEESFKLPAGSLVTYPATMLHRVAPVTRGERMVAAGWVRSTVRDPAHRELLFDLETARRRLFDREGKTAEGDLLAKCAPTSCACGATIEMMRRWRASVCAKTSRPVVPQFEFRLRAGCRRHPSRLLWNLRCLAKLQLTSRLQGSSTRRPGPRRMSSLTFSCLPWG